MHPNIIRMDKNAVPAGIEPATFRLTAERSNQLSYRTKIAFIVSYNDIAPTQARTGVNGS